MIPLRDSIQARTVPVVNFVIIGVTALCFFAQLQDVPEKPSLIEKYGMIPARIKNPAAEILIPVDAHRDPRTGEIIVEKREAAPSAVPPLLTMLTCCLLHGGWMHFLGNMWFLYIFGDNVEDRLGHVGYLIFYMASGVAASLVHFLSDPSSTMPTIGASGAIAGVMGAYFMWFRHSTVHALIPLGILTRVVELPAPIFLGIWFAMQLLPGISSIGGAESGGVAWWAHIGGFAVGALVALVVGKQQQETYEPRFRPYPEPRWR
jgi:membrane associated rhomboid family serine protease